MLKKLFILFLFCCSLQLHAQTVGWFYNNPGAQDGYVLFAPMSSDTTYLIDKCGKRVHTWASTYRPGLSCYLKPDGTLLRCGTTNNGSFMGGGSGGVIQKLDWNGNVLWQYQISDNNQCQHHDAIQLPNGNILAIVWENHTATDAIDNGRDPSNIGTKIWSDKLVEIQPSGTSGGTIVWQWRAWDHLIQDYDDTKPNYGVVSDHPELININLGTLSGNNADWLHCNGLDYNAATDQVLFSFHNMSEIYIIDHSTTTSEAATHSGGVSGHGGDFLYRWGNPQNYNRGTSTDEKFYGEHNPSWVPAGFPGAGKIMVFNNGLNRPAGNYSSVETITPPAMVGNTYPIVTGQPFAPAAQDWIYTTTPASAMYSMVISGAQRLINGNTIICDGQPGTFLEVDSTGASEWKYICPVAQSGIVTQGQNANGNSVFRCVYIAADYSGLAGHTLTPGAPIEINPLSYTCTSNASTDVTEINLDDQNVSVYPNPFQTSFVLHTAGEMKNSTLQIHDITGRLLFENKNFSASAGSDYPISVPDFHGMMLLTVQDAAGNYDVKKRMVAF